MLQKAVWQIFITIIAITKHGIEGQHHEKNLPITNNEVPYPEGEEIISTTSLKGIINSFNDTFQKISGFEAEELINKNHNVIRHPEMPPAAFDDLWKSMKSNHHWMGIIKNRVKMVTTIGLMVMLVR